MIARCAMAVMAKAPIPGRCKTRLCPPLSLAQAAAMSAAFLRDITENMALAAGACDLAPVIAYAPAGMQHLFAGAVAEGTGFVLADGLQPSPTGVEGFGRCLLHAVESLLALGHEAVCVLNSDSPTLPTRVLCEAVRLLAKPGDRVVLGPAEDGGYYLLGVKRAHAGLFADIAWSTDQVAEQTRARAGSLGLELAELPVWYDVDDAASLARVRAALLEGGDFYPAPATRAALAALDEACDLRAAS